MTDFINPDEYLDKSVSEVIRRITDGMGVDYSFECTGFAPLVNQAFEATKLCRARPGPFRKMGAWHGTPTRPTRTMPGMPSRPAYRPGGP
ncbi:hypothetical protein Q3G72_011941 [Acer saccharum]|nr:hypothetical protein Q3G72_011941 [Acer saccharum]